ncbi:MAG: hypothetical protein M0019_10000 [Actinomycetota bacterium]|nr:hypothetical protein [Actinomycetota bacterium]
MSIAKSWKVGLLCSAVLLSACATTPSASTSTTLSVEPTFGTLRLWTISHSVDGLYSVVYLDPYWLVFNQQDPTSKWKLKMPTNISSRRGIVLATNGSGVKAVGFIPYQGQKNTVVFEYGTNGAFQPSFIDASLLTSNQSMNYDGGDLFAIATSGSRTLIEDQSQSGGQFIQVASFPFASTNGAIGFSGSNGIAIFSSADGKVAMSTSSDGGKSWSNLTPVTSSGTTQEIFVASSSQSSTQASLNSPNFVVVTSSSSNSYQSSFFSAGSKGTSIDTSTPPIFGDGPNGALLEVDGAIGGTLTQRVFTQGALSQPSTLQGVQGGLEAIYGDASSTTVITTANGLPTSYSAPAGSDSFGASSSFDVSALNG